MPICPVCVKYTTEIGFQTIHDVKNYASNQTLNKHKNVYVYQRMWQNSFKCRTTRLKCYLSNSFECRDMEKKTIKRALTNCLFIFYNLYSNRVFKANGKICRREQLRATHNTEKQE